MAVDQDTHGLVPGKTKHPQNVKGLGGKYVIDHGAVFDPFDFHVFL
jgi:hypothetical protein